MPAAPNWKPSPDTSAHSGRCSPSSGDQLPQWIKRVRSDDLPSLHAFANGLERDLATVTAGLTLPWSSGVVEGHVNRIKMIKRQMYGRASFALLRKRVLLAS
ncbi:transposase [Streptomyces sp. NPDC089424]|uniref:transposase n=1 Tax=Streptomyces sp. NPDC089424 TaxID=3365917 RepID=UPI00382AEE87